MAPICLLRFPLPTIKYVIRNFADDAGVRVRFAPSPTGLLHLGGLRTALYNFLFSKSRNGSFILRIEDTDQSRLVDNAVSKLEEDLEWAGLKPDEGPSAGGLYGPYFQSQRLDLYKQEVDKLVTSGSAYFCFCSDRRLDLLRKDSLRRREIPKYDNHCRQLSKEEVRSKLEDGVTCCIRFKLTPITEPYEDLIFGKIVHNVAEFEGDPVILKSDGFPTYHLANVVDDHYMRISHVLRGVEWQPSTTKHLLLYKAFHWEPPNYAHLPLLMNTEGTKLSKRNKDMTIDAYRKNGIYPRALINFLTLCGGGFLKKQNTEKITRLKNLDELTAKFYLDLLNVNNCQIPFERLSEFNRIEIQQQLSDEKGTSVMIKSLRALIEEKFDRREVLAHVSDDKLRHVLLWSSTRISSLKDLISPEFLFLWNEPPQDSVLKCSNTFFEFLPSIITEIERTEDFCSSAFFEKLQKLASKTGLKHSEVMKSLRICLTGFSKGPGISEIFTQLGKETVIHRLKRVQCINEEVSRNAKRDL